MKILFIDTVHPSLKEDLESKKHVCQTAYTKTKSYIQKIVHNYEGIIIRSRFKIDKAFIDSAINLKFIARAGSGLENIDVNYAKKKNITCYNAPKGNKKAVAEHSLGMLLSLFNNLNIAHQEVQQGIWEREKNRGIELSGKTIAIIGYGNTGSAFKKVLKGLNVTILVYDKYLSKYPNKSTMKTIYENADILSLHIPLTNSTNYLINKNFINRFKKNFYLINTSRGKCVKTKDLVTALRTKKIKGACLDVLENEKKSFENLNKTHSGSNIKYLQDANNVILSPHIAGWTIESNIKIAKILLEKITTDFPQ